MATRIENSRTAKRVQSTMLWDVSNDAFVTVTGKVQRLDSVAFRTRTAPTSRPRPTRARPDAAAHRLPQQGSPKQAPAPPGRERRSGEAEAEAQAQED